VPNPNLTIRNFLIAASRSPLPPLLLLSSDAAASPPLQSRAVLEELYALWFAHLWDNIWSVRETTAVALGEVLRVYGDEAWARVMPVLKERLPQVRLEIHPLPCPSLNISSVSLSTC
jgi:hypothetical protein